MPVVHQNQHPADETSPTDVASPADVVSPADQGSVSSLRQSCGTATRKTHPSHNPLPITIPITTSTTRQTRINALTMKLMVCARRGLPCAIKEVGRACYQCNRTKHGCSLVVKQRHSRSRSWAPTTTGHRSPTPGPSLQPTRTNPPRSTRKRKTRSPSVRPSSTERGQQSESFYISFLFYSYSK